MTSHEFIAFTTTTTTVFGECTDRKGNVFPKEFGWNFRTERKIFRLMKILRLLRERKMFGIIL